MCNSIINEIYSNLEEADRIENKARNRSNQDGLSRELELGLRLAYVRTFFHIARAFHIRAEQLISDYKQSHNSDEIEKIQKTVTLSDDFYWLTSWLILGKLGSSELSERLKEFRNLATQEELFFEGKNCFYWGVLHCTTMRCYIQQIVDPSTVKDPRGIWESANIPANKPFGKTKLNEDAIQRFKSCHVTFECIEDAEFKKDVGKYIEVSKKCPDKHQHETWECKQCSYVKDFFPSEDSVPILADWVQDLLESGTFGSNRVRHLLPKSDSFIEDVWPVDPDIKVFPNLNVIRQLKSRLKEHRSYLHFLANIADIQSTLKDIQSQSEILTKSFATQGIIGDSLLSSWSLYILRDWNSFTPLLTAAQRNDPNRCSGGGGIFFKYGQRGIVIDPGFDFFRHFYEAELSPADITDVVVTHDHYDHSASLGALLNLLFEYRRRSKERFGVDFYLCRGIFDQYAHCIVDFEHFGIVVPLAEAHARTQREYKLGDHISMIVTETHHGASSGFGRGVGLIFKFQSEDERYLPSLGFTSDTGWSEDRQSGRNVATPFKDHDVNVIVLNIGSLKIDELRDSGYYKKHLGMRGVFHFIEHCAVCRLALLTEFGEECKGRRQWFADNITSYLRKHFQREDFQCFPTDHRTHVVAKDTGELYIGSRKDMHDYKKAKCSENFGSPLLSWSGDQPHNK